MKKILFILFAICSSTTFGQAYMDDIVDKTCDCVDHLSKDLDNETYTMKLGLCIINSSMPYAKQLKKEYGINLDNISKGAEKLGEVVGVKMIGVCPDALVLATDKIGNASDTDTEDEELEVEGTVTKVESNQFVVFTLKTDVGKSEKFYWLNEIKTDENLEEIYLNLEGKSVYLVYTEQSFFDPKLNEYRTFNIISEFHFND